MFFIKRNSLTIAFLLLIGHSFAIKLPGKLITRTGEVVNATLNISVNGVSHEPEFKDLQEGLKCVTEDGEKLKVTAYEFAEYQFEWEGELIRMISFSSMVKAETPWYGTDHIFLRLISDGPMQVFMHYYKVMNTPSMGYRVNHTFGTVNTYVRTSKSSTSGYVLRIPGEQPCETETDKFKFQMKQYFDMCPELRDKIINDEFTDGDYMSLVSYYNLHCAP